jgi:hypothetical protein
MSGEFASVHLQPTIEYSTSLPKSLGSVIILAVQVWRGTPRPPFAHAQGDA